MLWVLVGIGGLWLTVVSQSFRKVVLSLVALIALALLWFYLSTEREAAAEKALDTVIPHAQVVFSNVRVEDQNETGEISGTVRNDSDHDISKMTLSYQIFDCLNKSTPIESCVSIGKDDNIGLTDEVPSHSARSFLGFIQLGNVAKPSGVKKTIYNLVTVHAKA